MREGSDPQSARQHTISFRAMLLPAGINENWRLYYDVKCTDPSCFFSILKTRTNVTMLCFGVNLL